MLTEETLHKLGQMKLTGMLENYRLQEKLPGYNGLSFEERLGLMVDAEFTKRQQNRMDRMLAKAQFSLPGACLEDIHYRSDRQLNRQLLLELAAGNYIAHGRNIVINGATGAGKSYLAQALGTSACRQGISVCYRRLNDLLDELLIAKHRSTTEYIQLRKTFVRYPLLILDEWLTFPILDEEAEILLALIDRRNQNQSTMVVSQFAPSEWLEQIPNRIAAEAITDQLTAGSYHILIQGESSMRRVMD